MLQLTSWHHEAYSFTGGFNHNGWFLQYLIFQYAISQMFQYSICNVQCQIFNMQVTNIPIGIFIIHSLVAWIKICNMQCQIFDMQSSIFIIVFINWWHISHCGLVVHIRYQIFNYQNQICNLEIRSFVLHTTVHKRA